MNPRMSILTSSTRSGDGSRPDVVITISRETLNELSAMLLTLPREQFERWQFVSDNIDRYLAGYNYIDLRVDER